MKAIKDSLHRFISHNGLAKAYEEYDFISSWPKIIESLGKSYVDQTVVKKLTRPTLLVYVRDTMFMQVFHMEKRRFLKCIEEYDGISGIEDIRFLPLSQGYVKEREKNDTIDLVCKEMRPIDFDAIELPKAELEAMVKAADGVSDPKLRATFLHLQIRDAKRQRYLLQRGYRYCKGCGLLMPSEEGEYCLSCRNEQERQEVKAVKKFLWQYPFVRFADIQGRAPWSYDIFCKGRDELVSLYINKMYGGSTRREDMYRLAMLITGKRDTELTDQDVIRLTKRYRNRFDPKQVAMFGLEEGVKHENSSRK